jgi:CRP-like cAMP-binding protein
MICQSGSFVAGIHIILHGIISDRVARTGIRQPQCDILAVDDLIGLEILTNNSEAFSSSLCRAVTSVELLFIERSEFECALASHATLQRAVLHYITARYIEARRTSPGSSQLDAQCCRLLLRLATSCDPPAEGTIVTLPAEITLRTLSELLCISSRQLRDVRQSIQSLSRVGAHLVFDSDEIHRTIDQGACGQPGTTASPR